MSNFERLTKKELVEIIEKKENEILDLKEALRQLEKCQKYDDLTDEIRAVYMKLEDRGFEDAEALEIVQTLIYAGNIPDKSRTGYVSYRNYR